MVTPFTYMAAPSRVVFGPGRLAELGGELARLEIRRALVLCTPEQAGLAGGVAERLESLACGTYERATMHTPVSVTEDATAHAKALDADGLVAIGGGSTIGLGKALALRAGLPLVAVPTTYAGSEMTSILGETEGARKTTQRSEKVRPRTVIYDVELTLSLPAGLSATSGINALAHAVEALYAQDGNPIVSLMAEEGIAALGRSLPHIVSNPSGDMAARSDALYGAWLCGTCLGAVAMGLHHKICHVLGGTFDLPHAPTHTVMLPHTAEYNAVAAGCAMDRIARALGAEDAVSGLFALNQRLDAPLALRDFGMPERGIVEAVDLVLRDQYANPRPPERAAIEAMLRRAWAGEPPRRA